MVRLDDSDVIAAAQLLKMVAVLLRSPEDLADPDRRESYARSCALHAVFLDDKVSRAMSAEVDSCLQGPFDQDQEED